jgi:hypothetical protein
MHMFGQMVTVTSTYGAICIGVFKIIRIILQKKTCSVSKFGKKNGNSAKMKFPCIFPIFFNNWMKKKKRSLH